MVLSITVHSERVWQRSIKEENKDVLPSEGGWLTPVGVGASYRLWDESMNVSTRGAAREAPDGTKTDTFGRCSEDCAGEER